MPMRTALAALALVLGASSAFAEDMWPSPTGHMFDTTNRTQVMLNDPAEVGRMNYAKATCHSGTGVPVGMLSKAYLGCLRAAGFVFVPLTAEELQAQQQAIRDEQNRAALRVIGQAVGQAAAAIANPPPTRCNPHFLQTNCY
jgi:hypothetical protein